MPAEFEINLGEMLRSMGGLSGAVGASARDGMKSISQEWQRAARDEAPIDTSTLRREISRKLTSNANEITVEMTSNTFRRDFNYAYYQHEVKGDNYIERPVEQNLSKWERFLEGKIKDEVKKSGW